MYATRFYRAAMQGHSVIFTNAATMLNDLASLDRELALERRLRYYAQPKLLVIDEIGYLSYGDRHADFLFEIINRRHEKNSIIVTTNRLFSEWSEVFPNAACAASLINCLIHHSEILSIEADSFRRKEANAQASQKQKQKSK